MLRCDQSDADSGFATWRGLLNALLIAVPVWTVLFIAASLLLQTGPIEEVVSMVLMTAAACEAILARPYLRVFTARLLDHAVRLRAGSGREPGRRQALQDSPHADLEKFSGQRIQSIEDLLRYVEPKSAPSHESRRAPAPAPAPLGLLRQSLALSALVGAYLQYYFLDVNLQIASMQSITVFLPSTSLS